MKKLSVFIVMVIVLSLFMGENSVTAKEVTKVQAKAEITAVTVFIKGARIYRHAKVDLVKGEQQIVFEGYSVNMIDDSVRVLFEGAPKARISGIDIQTEDTVRLIKAEYEKLEAKETELTEQYNKLVNERSAFQAEIDFANGIIAQMKINENLSQDVEKLKELMAFVRDTIKKANDGILEITNKQRVIDKELGKIESERFILSDKYPDEQKNLIIRVSAPEAETVDMIISYITPEAMWKPSYDVRYKENEKKVDVITYGEIVQVTGEDWENVQLTLSTAEATATVALPDFMPSVVHTGDYDVDEDETKIEKIHVQFMRFNNVQTANQDYRNERRKLRNGAIIWDPDEGDKWENESKSYFTGNLARFMGTIVFELDEKRSINGDSRPHRTMLNTNEFDVEMDYFARPAISEFVYYHGILKNTTKSPILKGEMNIFVDSKFVGKWEMEPVAPGDEFDVYFGTVNELKIDRKVVKVLKEGPDPKNYRSSNLLTRELRITVENFFDKEVEVKILDSIPVSWSDEVKVHLTNITGDIEPDEIGRLNWTLKLKPAEESVIEYSYVVEYPEKDEVELEKWTEERYEKQKEYYEKNKK